MLAINQSLLIHMSQLLSCTADLQWQSCCLPSVHFKSLILHFMLLCQAKVKRHQVSRTKTAQLKSIFSPSLFIAFIYHRSCNDAKKKLHCIMTLQMVSSKLFRKKYDENARKMLTTRIVIKRTNI